MLEDKLRIRDEENMRTFHNIQHDPPKFLTGGTCRTDMPTSTWGNGIDMPGPTPKEYRTHKVNKVKELDSREVGPSKNVQAHGQGLEALERPCAEGAHGLRCEIRVYETVHGPDGAVRAALDHVATLR